MSRSDASVSNDNSTICGITDKIAWNGNNWAEGCLFDFNDFKYIPSKIEECYGICANDYNCTHFTWTKYDGGTCYLQKYDGVSKDNAVKVAIRDTKCGIV